MKLDVHGINEGQSIPGRFAFGVPDTAEHMRFSQNLNPRVAWSEAPRETKSFVLLVKDPDVPGSADDVNQEGKTVSADLPRVDFYHWVLVDIPSGIGEIEEGEDSAEVVVGGKPGGRVEKGIRGINSYTDFFAGNADLEGIYGGYDGPCPPWNDELMHHYHFTVYALDVDSLGLDGNFNGADVEQAMQGHILDQASVMGTYTLNPDLLTD